MQSKIFDDNNDFRSINSENFRLWLPLPKSHKIWFVNLQKIYDQEFYFFNSSILWYQKFDKFFPKTSKCSQIYTRVKKNPIFFSNFYPKKKKEKIINY